MDDESKKIDVVFTIAEFCDRFKISRPSFDNYVRGGVGPRLMRLPGRVFISAEAAADWIREREADKSPHPLSTAAKLQAKEEATERREKEAAE